jgi:competence protein ComGC
MNEEITRFVFRKLSVWLSWRVVALVVAFLLLPGVSYATFEQEALVGLKGVEVLVEVVKPEAEHLDLSKDMIKTDVELRLRKAGVKVLTQEDRLKIPGWPCLYVSTTILSERHLYYAVLIKVEVGEMVTLARGQEVYAPIWRTSRTGLLGAPIAIERNIRDKVGDLVDEFINDYLAANPK